MGELKQSKKRLEHLVDILTGLSWETNDLSARLLRLATNLENETNLLEEDDLPNNSQET